MKMLTAFVMFLLAGPVLADDREVLRLGAEAKTLVAAQAADEAEKAMEEVAAAEAEVTSVTAAKAEADRLLAEAQKKADDLGVSPSSTLRTAVADADLELADADDAVVAAGADATQRKTALNQYVAADTAKKAADA